MYTSYALYGSGNIEPKNVETLLTEYLPEEVGSVFRPEYVDRDMKGMRNVLDFLESEDNLGEGGCIPSSDLLASLEEIHESEGDNIEFLVLWPENPSNEDFDFIERLQIRGIKVHDLSRAMDEIDLRLYERPKEDKPKKTRKKAEPENLQEELPIDIPNPDKTAADILAGLLGNDAFVALTQFIDEKIQTALNNQTPHTLPIPTEPPPFDGPYENVEGKVQVYQAKDGTTRPAMGKPRRGEKVVWIDAA